MSETGPLDPPPPPDDILRALIDAERVRPDPSFEAQERVMARLAVVVGAPPSTAPAPSGGAGGGAAATTGSTPLIAHGLVRASVIFLAGALAGVGADRALTARRPATKTTTIAPAPTAPAASTPEGKPDETIAAPDRALPGEAPQRPAPESARAPVRSSPPRDRPVAATTGDNEPPAHRDRDLGGERNLIEIARTALGRGHADSALGSLRRHARLYPDGELREEREGLLIQALVVRGDVAAARERAARFRERYPHSLFTPAIEEALRSIP